MLASNRVRSTLARLVVLAVLVGTTTVVGATTSGATPTSAIPRSPGDKPATAGTSKVSAYWLVASDGGVFSFGGAGFYGSTGGTHLNKPIVGMAGTSDSHGYWLVASDGGIFAFGDAAFYGSMGGTRLNKPVVGMTANPNGKGYWMVASDGGIFSFGSAPFYGSMGAHHLNQPVVGMAATPDGKGYWLVAADGGIFAFGDAAFFGSTGNIHLNQPIVGMTTAPGGKGYWFTAADGGVFAFGKAPFYGSLGNVPQSRPVVAMAADRQGDGYWFTNQNGAVTAYGGAVYWGSAPQVLNEPVVGMAEADATGHFTGSPYPSGSYGYDISNYQCGNLPASPHTVGLVQVVGESMGKTNPCLVAEAAWAGAGLNLYVYLTYGVASSSNDPACQTSASPAACNYGFDAALDAFSKATAARVDTSVAWWLDIEPAPPGIPGWSSYLAANAALVQGAIDGLHFEGLNGVGIYASPGSWSGIVGSDYSPAVPYWAADWDIAPAITCNNVKSLYRGLPRGPVQIVQYSSPSYPYPAGGMSTAFDDDYAC